MYLQDKKVKTSILNAWLDITIPCVNARSVVSFVSMVHAIAPDLLLPILRTSVLLILIAVVKA